MPNDKRERLIELIDKAGITHFIAHYNDVPKVINTLADYLLKNDVVPVVRCKDCEYCLENDNNEHICSAQTDPNYVRLNDFCSYGIPREE